MSENKHTPEPFGYFKAEPFGWTDCSEDDDGAIPLYDNEAIEEVCKQRDELLEQLQLKDAKIDHITEQLIASDRSCKTLLAGCRRAVLALANASENDDVFRHDYVALSDIIDFVTSKQ